ncbi:GxxExxY protein [Methanorbis furvi]|uniref:GxxExxY protein n=1 Tax=Methanorbis furvi TaxID=3028299 RepID=A0AAE4S8S1_9EURY|nr:hypothetical protein [Methanocorpusculaceae archaeon Ag1]
MSLIFEDETYRIRGAVFEVYKSLGPGFLESVYQSALEHELKLRGIPFESQKELPVSYKNISVGKFRADIVCYNKIILELKAVEEITNEHLAQIKNYLKITNFDLGLLINFNHHPGVDIRRCIRDGVTYSVREDDVPYNYS